MLIVRSIKEYITFGIRCFEDVMTIINRNAIGGGSYKDCDVCERWMKLSNFASDIIQLDGYKDWENKRGYCLDKDTIIQENKLYSPSTCCFIHYSTNIREANKRTNSIKAAQDARKVIYFLEKDGETLIFDSESAACEYLGVRQCSVSSCRIKGYKCKGYSIRCAKMDAK